MSTDEWGVASNFDETFDATVSDAYFEEGDYGVQLVLVLDNGDNEFNKYYGVGKKVTLVNEGEVDCSANKNNMFHKSSAIGELVQALVADENLIGQVASKGSPREAASWKGLSATWETFTRTATIEGEKREWERLLPTGATSSAAKEEEAPPAWLLTLCGESADYDSFLEAALASEELDASSRKLVLNESFWDFS